MGLKLYMDQHVSRSITSGLRLRGVDVLTAFEDGAEQLPDPELLDRSGKLGRVLFTQDSDLLQIAAERQQSGIPFGGLIYGHQLRITIGQCVMDLELMSRVLEPGEMHGVVFFLPMN